MSVPRKEPLLPVVPLDEERWAAFEDRLFDALDRERREGTTPPPPSPPAAVSVRRRWRAVSLAVIAVAAVLLAVQAGWLLRARLATAPAEVSPTRMVTGTSPSRVVLGDNELELGAETAAVAIGDDARGVVVVVERGRVTCTVAPRGGRPPFVVQAGEVRVRVVGTRFSVARIGEGARVEVDHGAVEVSSGTDRLTLRDGQSWTARPAAATGGPAPTALAMAPDSTAAEDGPAAPAPSYTPSVPSSGQAARVQSPRERFEAAARLERSDPARAVALYALLAAAGGSWGANALFAEARLEAERGRRAEAGRLAAEYLARFPNGPNAADARLLLGGN
jgi:hypothetical protein